MAIYLFNFVWTWSMALLGVKYGSVKKSGLLEKKIILPNLLFIGLILVSFICFYALRWQTGTDFVNYYAYYFIYGKTEITELIGTRDWGFSVLTAIIYKIWPNNFIIYNFFLAALTYIPVVLTFRKHSRRFVFTILLYITMLAYYWPYNGVRQSIACSICFFAYPLLYDKKYFKYTFSVLVAYLFHSTALLLIPIMFIVTQKAWSKLVIITVIVFISSLIILPSQWNNLITFIEFIGQDKMANDYNTFNHSDDGANILRLIVYLIPVLISAIFYRKLKRNNPKIDLLINMSLMCGLFMLFASQLTVLGRVSNYFIFFNALLIPEFTGLFKEKDKLLFKVITVALFFIYMFLLLPVDSDLLPYKFILNN